MTAALNGVRVCILRRGPVGHDKRTRQIAARLSRAGARVTVIAATGSSSEYETSGGFRVREVGPLRASTASIRPVRIVSNVLRNRVRGATLFFSMIAAIRACRPDVVHCMNIDTLLVGWLGSLGGRFVYDSREHFATAGNVSPSTRRWWLLKERLLLPRAAGILAVTPLIADALEHQYRIPRPTVLVNGCTERVSTAQPAHDPMRFIHQGKFFFDRHLDDVIVAIARQRGRATLTLQGWGQAEETLRTKVAELDAAQWVSFVDPSPPEDVVSAASQHDVGIINIWPDSLSHRLTGSNKLFDYMGAGLAELVTNLDYTRGIVEREGVGVIFDPPDVDALTAAMARMIEEPRAVAEMKRRAVDAAAKYSWDAQEQVLFDFYRAVLYGRHGEGF